MKTFLIITGLVVLVFGYLIVRLVISNKEAMKVHKDIFEKGTRRSGVVVGWYDLNDRRHEDDSQDIVYTGGDTEKDSYSFTKVILSYTDKDGNDVEVVMDTYPNPDEDEELLLSKKYKLGVSYDFYEFEGRRRFANERWLAE